MYPGIDRKTNYLKFIKIYGGLEKKKKKYVGGLMIYVLTKEILEK